MSDLILAERLQGVVMDRRQSFDIADIPTMLYTVDLGDHLTTVSEPLSSANLNVGQRISVQRSTYKTPYGGSYSADTIVYT